MTPEATDIHLLVARALAGEQDAVESVILAIQDDVYGLALRMLGERAAAEDATQEILLQVLTHLSQWRGEAKLGTWAYRIAVRHLLRARRTRLEELAGFEALTELCKRGESHPPLPSVSDAELTVLEREVRLVCTEGMLLSLDRDHRIAWVLDEVFGVSSDEAAQILDIEAATFRKRVQRARQRLGTWMNENCGLVGAPARCQCRRQIPVATAIGVVRPGAPELSVHPVRSRDRRVHLDTLSREAELLERAANVLCSHPDYAAPDEILRTIREVISSKQWRLFEHDGNA